MNTPTKRIFYLFGAKIAKNEPQTKVWGSLTCKPQSSQPVARVFALVARPRGRADALLDAGFLLGALDSSHLLLGKPNGTVIFSVVRSGTTVITQVGASCFQRRHVVRRA